MRRDALRLRRAMRDAAWTQHLEGMQYNDLAAQRRKRERGGGVEPAVHAQRRRGNVATRQVLSASILLLSRVIHDDVVYWRYNRLVNMVSLNYYWTMANKRVFDLIERIGALLRSDARRHAMPHELQPVHLQALDYLQRANRFSDTPLAVGEYLGLTKGNISQRVNLLEKLELIRKEGDQQDGRVVHLRLTAAGKRLLQESYPPSSWRELEERMRNRGGRALEAALTGLLHTLIAANGFRTFGQCKTCRFHQRKAGQAFCGLLQVELEADQTGKICREHQPLAA
jgi:DNA-binding MarR family transcriptional regulator